MNIQLTYPLLSVTAGTLCLLGLLGSTGLRAEDAKGAKPAAAPKASMTVTTTLPVQSKLAQKLAANGSISAWQDASVGAEVNGLRLAEVHAAVGDRVKRDQLLAVFSSESVQADVAQARAALSEASAQAQDAAANAARARTLQDTGAMSAQQISQLLTAELSAMARLESARATLQQQELRLKNTRVMAPDSGIVSVRNATVGAVVGAGTELFRLIRQGRLEWRAEVTSSELGRLKVGTRASITSTSGAQVEGKVRMVGPTVDPQTRTALVYVDLPPDARGLLPGMFARGEFELGSSSALTVPQQAVVVRDGFNYVFKVGPDNRVAQQKVEVGRRNADQVEITLGLTPQQAIAVQGAGFLNDGDTVRVNNGAVLPAAKDAKP